MKHEVNGGDGDRGRAETVMIVGGGPAGLTAAYELQKRSDGFRPVVFEGGNLVGGISRTESLHGNRFDIGGHRFFTKVPEVEAMWHEVLGDDFLTRPRMSRIYYRGKFYSYPLKVFNALGNIGPYEAGRIVLSYIKWQVRPNEREDNFEEWVINRFGGRLYMHFFGTYTQKVWGISPRNIQADWAEQRIKNLSLGTALWNAVSGANNTASLIEEFKYPRLGPGMMWEKTADRVVERGGEVHMRSAVTKVYREGMRVMGMDVERWSPDADVPATTEYVHGDHFINTMALRDLIHAFDPPPPPHVVAAAEKLKYRDFLIVALILDTADPFPDNWIYVHTPAIKVGRIQNFRAWSPEMVSDPDTASIGMEYFCHEGDGLWTMSNADLANLAGSELEKLGLGTASSVKDFAVIRQKKAYPVYDADYKDALAVVSDWLKGLENFQTVGRNGLHRYNNQDHSMLSAMLAARNILGENNDVWSVNVERAYHEEFEVKDKPAGEAAELANS